MDEKKVTDNLDNSEECEAAGTESAENAEAAEKTEAAESAEAGDAEASGSCKAEEEESHASSDGDEGKKKSSKEDKKHKSRIAALEKETESLKKQVEEINDKYLRIMAEYENFRRRSQKEKEGVYSDAVADSVKELLPLFDNLERASAYEEGDKLAEGLRMILKTVPEVLAKMKVESFGAVGERFDPNIHNAIMHEENEELGESEITEVFQKGYKIGDKIIRHAMVKVAN